MISIIIPIYNVEKYLKKCIESILEQSYKDIELLLINDGSTDSSAEICNYYAYKYSNVKVFHKENSGVSAARNLGLRLANGEYITFVDSDDWIEYDMYENMITNIENTQAQMCICTKYIRNNQILENSKILKPYLNKQEAIQNILDYNFPSSLCNSIYKKDILNDIFLDESIHHLEDFEFQFKVINNVEKIAICNDAFYNYRKREGSANNNGFNYKIVTCLEIIKSIEKLIIENEKINNNYIEAVKGRMTLTVCIFMVKSNYKDKSLEKLMVNNARKSLLKTMFTNIPYKKKILVILLSVSYKIFDVFYSYIK